MSYVVYVQDSVTGKLDEVGVYDKPPLIIAEDGSSFSSVKLYGTGTFQKADN